MSRDLTSKSTDANSHYLVEAATMLMPKMLATIRRLVELESPTDDLGAINALVSVLESELSQRGFDTSIIVEGGRPHLLGRSGSGKRPLLILSHMDTVWPIGTLEEMALRQEGDYLFGPGVADMKAGIAVVLTALDVIRASELELEQSILYLITSDEETGSTSSRALIEKLAKQSCAVLVTEPGDPPDGKVKTSRKGTGMFQLSITGRKAHSGVNHQDGVSAINELASQIQVLEGLTDYSAGTTLNVGVIKGGTARNVVADTASALVDVRVTSAEESERIRCKLEALKPNRRGAKLVIEGSFNRPPMEKSKASIGLYGHAVQLAGELGVELPETSSGGASDGNFTAALGIPTLDGLGAVGTGLHASDERIHIPSLPVRTALLAQLLLQPYVSESTSDAQS